MDYSSIARPRGVATLIVTASLLALSACMSAGGSLSPAAKSSGASVKVPQGSCPGGTAKDGYCWYTVDLGASNEIAGINNSDDIVGNYAIGTCKYTSGDPAPCADCPIASGSASTNDTRWSSYTAEFNSGYTTFTAQNYPNEESQYLYGISDRLSGGSSTIEVGCLVNPGGNGGVSGGQLGTTGLVDNAGLWSFLSQPNASGTRYPCGGKPRYGITELLGIDDSDLTTKYNHPNLAVGFRNYTKTSTSSNCPLEAWEDSPGDNRKLLNVTFGHSASNVEATAISADGTFVAGSAMIGTSSGNLRGWVALLKSILGGSSNYVTPSWSYELHPTALTGVRTIRASGSYPESGVVGWYTQGSATHGLVATIVKGSKPVWTPVDEPNATGYTVISGTNSRGDICGWYIDSSSGTTYHGFVGIVDTAGKRRNARRSTVRPRA